MLGVALFGLAIYAMETQLKSVHFKDVRAAFHALSWTALLAALGLTAINYVTLGGYDALALRYIQHPMPYRRVAFASFVGYAFSNSVGFAAVTGGSVRWRLYSTWGLTPGELSLIHI